MTKISTDEAEELIDEGVPYVDIRTVEEFEDGHVPGSFNIPFLHSSPAGRVSNPDFLKVLAARFAKDEKFIIACKAGGRSESAMAILKEAGFEQVVDMTAGFEGKKGTFGEFIPGWSAEGREVTNEAEPERSYAELRSHAGLEE